MFKNALHNDKLTVKVEKLKNESISSIITLSEEGRRMQDMMKMYALGGMGGMDLNMFAADQTLTLNANHALVKYIFEHKDSEHVPMFCEQLYDLAVLANQPLSVEAMSRFVERSNQIMMLLANRIRHKKSFACETLRLRRVASATQFLSAAVRSPGRVQP